MNSKERMESWKSLPQPKPSWEDWKRILQRSGMDVEKAKKTWYARVMKKLQREE